MVLLCVGKLSLKFYEAAAKEYVQRLSRYTKLSVIEVPDLPEPMGASPAQQRQVVAREGAALLQHIKPQDHVTALCIEGKARTSEEFAQDIARVAADGKRHVFVIGGSLGLSPEVADRANEKLSFSAMTFPHQLARVMLLEQVYRAHKINAGERYHK